MSKSKAKKPVLSEEERRARMAALTSDVAAINLLDGGTLPVAPPVAAPSTVLAEPAAASAPEVAAAAATPLTPASEAQPVAAPPPAVEQPPTTRPAAPAAASEPEALLHEEEEDGGGGEEAPTPATAHPVAPVGELDLAALFAPAAGKKDTTLRITAAHQQFFSQLGVVLGNGASAPDIIHNILTQFRAQHEATLSRLVRRALTKQFK